MAMAKFKHDIDPTILTMFLTDVSRKLSPEGVQLLKALYCNTLPLRELDGVEDPRQLYYLCLDRDAASDIPAQEGEKLSPQDSLALFLHRLELLVPQTTEEDEAKRVRELKKKDVGAQACLDSFQQYGITPPNLTVVISQESKMLECLVRCYVNMTPRQRSSLKQELGEKVGIHPEQATIFDNIVALFKNQDRENRCDNVVSVFVSSLQQALSPRQTFTDLEQNLNDRNVPHITIPIPEHDTKPEIDYELEEDIKPVIEQEHHLIVRRERRKMTRYCSCLCLPVLLGVLVVAVAMPIFSSYLKDNKYYCEDNGYLQLPDPAKCANIDVSSSVSFRAAILVGKVNSFWYDSVSISQLTDKNSNGYKYTTVSFFLVPLRQLHIHNLQYSCSRENLYMDIIFYFLKGSSFNITMCVQSTSEKFPGVQNFTICTSYSCYFSRENYLEQYQIFVAPNETNCTSLQFTAQNNSFHYLTSASISRIANSTLAFYQISVSLLYLNSSVWENKESICTSDGLPPCKISIKRESLFQAEEYAIVATVSSGKDDVGNLLIEEHNRRLAYAVPAIAAGGLMVLGLITVSIIIGAYCFAKRKQARDTYIT